MCVVGVEPTNRSHNVLQHKDFVKFVGKNVGNKNLKRQNVHYERQSLFLIAS
jgi:hypothetical protein